MLNQCVVDQEIGNTKLKSFSGPQEWVRFIDKIVVFYTNEDTDRLTWLIIPKEQIAAIDPDRYLFFVEWPFDAYLHFLGRKVEDKLFSILRSAINLTALVSTRYYLNCWTEQRKAAVKAVRRRALRLMRRYYKGTFLTKRFKGLLIRLVSMISSKIFLSFQENPTHLELCSELAS